MPTHTSQENRRCWACGRVTEAPVRGLCIDCYTSLQQPGRIGHAFVEGSTRVPPFVPRRIGAAEAAPAPIGP